MTRLRKWLTLHAKVRAALAGSLVADGAALGGYVDGTVNTQGLIGAVAGGIIAVASAWLVPNASA